MRLQRWPQRSFLLLLILSIPYAVLAECLSGDCVNGYGRAVWPNGGSYEGEWRNGKFHGRGVAVSANGSVYDGEWDSHRKHGRGRFELPSGIVYDGGWVIGRKSGQAIVTWPSGDRYTGSYHDNARSGHGTYRWASGREYTGEWLDGKEHGQGTKVLTDGREFTGQWRAGLLHGVVVTTWPSGRVVMARYENDELRETLSDTSPEKGRQTGRATPDASGPPPATAKSAARLTREVQRLLTALGYRPGPVDGVMGQRTRRAIRDFQGSESLAVDGRVSAALLEQLEARVAQGPDKQGARAATTGGALEDLEGLDDF